MKFRFIGDPHDDFSGPDAIEMFGHRFTRNGWTKVADSELAAKLETNSHFDVDYSHADLSSVPTPVEHPHKKGGWPKGRPRGPRKHA